MGYHRAMNERRLGSPLTVVMAVVAWMVVGAGCSKSAAKEGPDAAAGSGATAGAGGGPGTGGAGATDGGADHPVSSDGAADVPAATRAEQACRDAIIVQCLRQATCRGSLADQKACEEYADRCPEYYFGPRSSRTVEGVEACTASIRQMTCTDIVMGLNGACLGGGTGIGGAPCSAASECASRACSGINPSCGTCYPALDLGAPCPAGVNGACRSGTVCHPGTRICVALPLTVAHARAGEPCNLAGDPPVGCEGDLVCLVPRTSTNQAGTCTAPPGAGQPCLDTTSAAQCAVGLSCGVSTADAGRTSLCGAPAPCGTTTCTASEFCYESTTVSIRCQPYSTAGQPCYYYVPEGNQYCGAGLLCTSATPPDGGVRGTCNAPVGLGDACDGVHVCRDPFVCKNGSCARFDPESCLQPADGGGGQ
jgi:hypothetical protein